MAVRVEAPLNVESVITLDRARRHYIIHLVDSWRAGRAIRMNRETLIAPMEEGWKYTARVFLDSPFKRARAASTSARVQSKGSSVEIETSEVHDALIIEL